MVDLEAGVVVAERYRVVGRLGHGGAATVYEVEHVDLLVRFALKLLAPDLAQNADVSERFLREARLAARFDIPQMVRVVDFGRWESRPYLVMERLVGSTLGHILQAGTLAPRAFVELMVQVLDGLEAAHALGVVHRDLKPDNLFVVDADQGPTVKILDLGIAKFSTSDDDVKTAAGAVFGTPRYMAPEQVTGETVDRRADLYAVGIICFEGLSGRPPFIGAAARETLQQQVTAPVPRLELEPLDGLDCDALAGVIEQAMQKDPDARPPSAATLSALLKACFRSSTLEERDRTELASSEQDLAGSNIDAEGSSSPPAASTGTAARFAPWITGLIRSARARASMVGVAIRSAVVHLRTAAPSPKGASWPRSLARPFARLGPRPRLALAVVGGLCLVGVGLLGGQRGCNPASNAEPAPNPPALEATREPDGISAQQIRPWLEPSRWTRPEDMPAAEALRAPLEPEARALWRTALEGWGELEAGKLEAVVEALGNLAPSPGQPRCEPQPWAVQTLLYLSRAATTFALRRQAYEGLEAWGCDHALDRVAYLTNELRRNGTNHCKLRKWYVGRLAALLDPATRETLVAERDRRVGFLGLRATGACLTKLVNSTLSELDLRDTTPTRPPDIEPTR